MKKKRYITPRVEVESAWTQPLLTSSPLEEGQTETGGGLNNDEVEEGLARENIWGYDFDYDW